MPLELRVRHDAAKLAGFAGQHEAVADKNYVVDDLLESAKKIHQLLRDDAFAEIRGDDCSARAAPRRAVEPPLALHAAFGENRLFDFSQRYLPPFALAVFLVVDERIHLRRAHVVVQREVLFVDERKRRIAVARHAVQRIVPRRIHPGRLHVRVVL